MEWQYYEDVLGSAGADRLEAYAGFWHSWLLLRLRLVVTVLVVCRARNRCDNRDCERTGG